MSRLLIDLFAKYTRATIRKNQEKNGKRFQQCLLKITIETNLQITDFLHVTSNLKNRKYYPFRKANKNLLDINHLLNHSKVLLKKSYI